MLKLEVDGYFNTVEDKIEMVYNSDTHDTINDILLVSQLCF